MTASDATLVIIEEGFLWIELSPIHESRIETFGIFWITKNQKGVICKESYFPKNEYNTTRVPAVSVHGSIDSVIACFWEGYFYTFDKSAAYCVIAGS